MLIYCFSLNCDIDFCCIVAIVVYFALFCYYIFGNISVLSLNVNVIYIL